MPKVSTPILLGSIGAAATVGYAFGTGRLRRRPNPGEEFDPEDWVVEDAEGLLRPLEENPTGFPMSAGEIDKGPHAGKVMYRPKLKGQKQRPRIYIEPGSAESLEELTEDTVGLRQEKAGRKRRPGAKTKSPPVKKKPEKKAAKKATKKVTKKAAKKSGKKKAPPRVANPGASTTDMVRRLEF